MKLERLDRVAAAILLGQLGLAGYIHSYGGAGPLPMHFAINGQPDRWGDRTELAGWILAITALNGVLYVLLPTLSRGRGQAQGAAGVAYARLTLLAVGVFVSLMMTAIGMGAVHSGAPADGQRLIMGFMALLMLGVGTLVGKAGPNPFVGARTYWALRSRLAWDRSNRLLGRLWFWCGLAALFATPLAPQPLGTIAMVGAMMATTSAAVFESWRVWRSDPDRAAA
ncbi:MAG: SdpI family protein [Caulobacteraceae bacterium]|nr:SdpI family protein [Caulobacteraceae bacterium]